MPERHLRRHRLLRAGNHSLNNQYSVEATNVFGGHQVKYGVEYDDVDVQQHQPAHGPDVHGAGRPADGDRRARSTIIADPDLRQDLPRDARELQQRRATTPQNYVNFFVQDTWKVGDRLTINPGSATSRRRWPGTLITDFQLKNNWAPRIGATYDLTGDGKTKLFGNFGIFYARIPNDLAARALSADDGISRADYFDANLTQPIPDGTSLDAGGASTNHFLLAGRRRRHDRSRTRSSRTCASSCSASSARSWPNTTFGVRYINRRIPRVLEDVANCPMVAYDLVGDVGRVRQRRIHPDEPDQRDADQPGAARDRPQFGSVKFDDPVHKYDAVEFTLQPPDVEQLVGDGVVPLVAAARQLRGVLSRRQRPVGSGHLVALRLPDQRSDLHVDRRRAVRLPGRHPLPGRRERDPAARSSASGKLFGNYAFPCGLNLGLGFNVSSGKPLTPLAAEPELRERRRNPGAPRGIGHPDGRRVQDAHAVPEPDGLPGGLRLQDRRDSQACR